VNWLNTAFILLLITVAVAAVVGSLARQLLGSIFDLDPDTERGDSVTSDPQRPSPHALRGFSRAARDSHRRRNAGT
jgi:hypothetical protein